MQSAEEGGSRGAVAAKRDGAAPEEIYAHEDVIRIGNQPGNMSPDVTADCSGIHTDCRHSSLLPSLRTGHRVSPVDLHGQVIQVQFGI